MSIARPALLGLLVAAVAAGPPACSRQREKVAGPEKESAATDKVENAVVVMETSAGTIKIQLWGDKAPITVRNFLRYADEKFYDGTIFHRVIADFMIQGGGFTPDMEQKPTGAPIRNEASSELKNARGTIAMARTGVVDSATAQFFINVSDDNSFLDHRDSTPKGFGYAVFGGVLEGMDVVDKIRRVPTGVSRSFKDVPVTPVMILSVRRAPAGAAHTQP